MTTILLVSKISSMLIDIICGVKYKEMFNFLHLRASTEEIRNQTFSTDLML